MPDKLPASHEEEAKGLRVFPDLYRVMILMR